MSAPSAAPRWTRDAGPKRLGLVMIVRDEAARLPTLFADVAEVVDEVVVVDTGSVDGTREVCRAWGVTLLERRWRDDFAWARNEGLARATASHLLWLDGDDRVPPDAARRLAELRDAVLPDADDRAFRVTVHNVGPAGERLDSFRQVRVIPNRPGIRYRGAIHESFMESLAAAKVRVEALPIELHHAGYATPEARRAKAERNAALLRAEVARQPGSIHARVHLAQALAGMDDAAGAARCMDEVVSLAGRASGHEEVRAELLALRAGYLRASGDAEGARRDLEEARRLRPGWGPATVPLGEVLALEGRWDRLAELVGGGEPDFSPGSFGAPLERLESAFDWLVGRCDLERGRVETALPRLRRAHERDPARADFRLDLARAGLEGGRFAEARELLEPLTEDEAAIPRLFELLAALGLARAGTGDLAGAGACLAPLLDLLGSLLPDPDDASPAELAAALESVGHASAGRHLRALEALVSGDGG